MSLRGYLLLNPVIALVTLRAEREDRTPPRWIKPIILLSIPWAVSIHTVTAFLYNGLPGRSLWLTAILPRDFWPRLSRPLGTLVTSIVGVAIFEILARTQLSAGAAVRPD